MEAMIGLLGGFLLILIAFIISQHQAAPKLIGPEYSKDKALMKTYTIINSDGEKEVIMTSKSMKEFLSELDYYANKKENECIS